jgi:MFS superfamily sulfate permease-like transporter
VHRHITILLLLLLLLLLFGRTRSAAAAVVVVVVVFSCQEGMQFFIHLAGKRLVWFFADTFIVVEVAMIVVVVVIVVCFGFSVGVFQYFIKNSEKKETNEGRQERNGEEEERITNNNTNERGGKVRQNKREPREARKAELIESQSDFSKKQSKGTEGSLTERKTITTPPKTKMRN